MPKNGLIIAIDGPGGVGKSTVSRGVASRLGYAYVNTGAMYRAFALSAVTLGVHADRPSELKNFCEIVHIDYDLKTVAIRANGVDYTEEVKTMRAGELASIYSSKKPVREYLVAYQRSIGASGKVVMEGRDIGTMVFPDADIKIFLDASPEVRAKRRADELNKASAEVAKSLAERDERDATRKESPLVKAEDAILVDTSNLNINGVIEAIITKIFEKFPAMRTGNSNNDK